MIKRRLFPGTQNAQEETKKAWENRFLKVKVNKVQRVRNQYGAPVGGSSSQLRLVAGTAARDQEQV